MDERQIAALIVIAVIVLFGAYREGYMNGWNACCREWRGSVDRASLSLEDDDA